MNTFLLLVIFVVGGSVAHIAELKICFVNFVNPGGEGDNGHCCDGRWGFCEDNGCDHYFKICLDEHTRSNKLTGCHYLTKESRKISNQDNNTFNKWVGNLRQPFVVKLNSVPEKVTLKVDVWDKDGIFKADHVDFLKADIQLSSHKTAKTTLKTRTSLSVTVEVVCAANHYGASCNAKCHKGDKIEHCDMHGKAICAEGWKGSSCSEEKERCAVGWTDNRQLQSCYLVDNPSKNWTDALQFCQQKGAHLLSIGSLYEQHYINGKLKERNVTEAVWTGLTNEQNHEKWTWSNGDEVQFEHWAHVKPPKDGGHCAAILHSNDTSTTGMWGNLDCLGNSLSFICEKKMWFI